MLSRFSCNVFPYKNPCRIPTITSTFNAFWFVIHCYHIICVECTLLKLIYCSPLKSTSISKTLTSQSSFCAPESTNCYCWIYRSIHSSIQLSCLMYVFTQKTKTLNQNNTNTDQSTSPHAHLLTTTHNTQHFSLINFISFVLFCFVRLLYLWTFCILF